ncbi:MAG: LamG domain-containing protein, partial [Planctomycetes bacterium]|nr:LamG domain-containing protein [Planctomycetota bacterium]
LRYDVAGDFETLSSWSSYDPAWGGVGTAARGYAGAVTIGPNIYFAPEFNGSQYHAEVIRFSRISTFTSASSWSAFSPAAAGTDFRGFVGAATDGRYAYFVPSYNGTAWHGGVLRFDGAASGSSAFTTESNWSAHDPGTGGLGYALDGFRGAVFDGRHLFFVPARNAEIARYDALGSDTSWKLSFSLAGQDGGFSAGPFGFAAVVNTPGGAFVASANRRHLANAWIHAAAVFDGSELRLYLNGTLERSVPASGTLQVSVATLLAGMVDGSGDRISKFWGTMDEIRLYGRALAAGEIRAHAERRKWADPEPRASAAGVVQRR